jgi:ribonuclease HI
MQARRTKIYFDGGCRPNPGEMAAAVVLRGEVHHFPDLGTGTNSDAEWIALIRALRLAHIKEPGEFDLLGDSAVIVNQATGVWPCRAPELRRHLEEFAALRELRAPTRIRRIARSQNLAGIALERLYAKRR